jgi:hypothetical protein
MRALGVDLGTKRIGIAISDSAGTVASPFEVVHRSGDRQREFLRRVGLFQKLQTELPEAAKPLLPRRAAARQAPRTRGRSAPRPRPPERARLPEILS